MAACLRLTVCATARRLLSVTYAQPYYNPSVMCGTIMLKPDIQSIPVFKWQEAAADSLYTMLMIDPDGNINGSWAADQQCPPPGDVAPVRHGTWGNIPGSILRAGLKGETGAETVISPYGGPGITSGSHRYGWLVFKQPAATKISFAPLNNSWAPHARFNFEVAAFLELYKLGKPVASNYMLAFAADDGNYARP